MLNEKIISLLNNQVNKELYSSYLYYAMSSHFKEKGLPGFGSWFEKQAKEELEHAEKIVAYLHQEHANVVYEDIRATKTNFKDVVEALTFTLKHEQFVTSLINTIYDYAVEIKDYRSQLFLNWFINEQAEEESSVSDLLDQATLLSDSKHSLFVLDQQLGSRK